MQAERLRWAQEDAAEAAGTSNPPLNNSHEVRIRSSPIGKGPNPAIPLVRSQRTVNRRRLKTGGTELLRDILACRTEVQKTSAWTSGQSRL